MPDWLENMFIMLLATCLITALVVGIEEFRNWVDRHKTYTQQLCIEHGYIEEIYYSTQRRYFCIGLNNGEWQIVPVEQLEAE